MIRKLSVIVVVMILLGVVVGKKMTVRGVNYIGPAVSQCGWCGTECVKGTEGQMCIQVAPPVGKGCVSDGSGCKVVDEVWTEETKCPLLRQGDLDCDGSITMKDFYIWKVGYLGATETRTGTVAPTAIPTSRLPIGTAVPQPTEPPVELPAITGVSQSGSCMWCGSNCIKLGKTDTRPMCPDVVPPMGAECQMIDGVCQSTGGAQ